MSKKIDKDLDKQIDTKLEIRKLEEFYVNGTIADLMPVINEKKEELVKDMIVYASEHRQPVKWDKEGNPISFAIITNPLVVNNKFFKSIVPLGMQEPCYNAEKLSLVFDYYCDLVSEVNDKIGDFPSSLTSFCKLAGITLTTLRNYKNSPDYNMRVIVEKIYDQIGDENITLSQIGRLSEKTTIFKLKTQNEIIEKVQPTVHINITEQPDMERIAERLSKYSNFSKKRENKK